MNCGKTQGLFGKNNVLTLLNSSIIQKCKRKKNCDIVIMRLNEDENVIKTVK